MIFHSTIKRILFTDIPYVGWMVKHSLSILLEFCRCRNFTNSAVENDQQREFYQLTHYSVLLLAVSHILFSFFLFYSNPAKLMVKNLIWLVYPYVEILLRFSILIPLKNCLWSILFLLRQALSGAEQSKERRASMDFFFFISKIE